MVTVNIFLCLLQTVIIETFILDVRLVKIGSDCDLNWKKKQKWPFCSGKDTFPNCELFKSQSKESRKNEISPLVPWSWVLAYDCHNEFTEGEKEIGKKCVNIASQSGKFVLYENGINFYKVL